jgi:hypothetical protein
MIIRVTGRVVVDTPGSDSDFVGLTIAGSIHE